MIVSNDDLSPRSILGLLACCALSFVPAGTLSYWQGRAFIAVFLSVSLVMTGLSICFAGCGDALPAEPSGSGRPR
jgi:hypothetical protein